MHEFSDLFSIEFSAGCDDPPSIMPLGTIKYLCAAGKAGFFVHNLREAFPQWMTLCRLEEALIDNKQNEDWVFVVGSVVGEPEIQGWLEHGDFILIPYGPEMQKGGDQMGVWLRSDFDELDYSVYAFCAADDDSGIILNRMVRETCPERYPLGAGHHEVEV